MEILTEAITYRNARLGDVDGIIRVEKACFSPELRWEDADLDFQVSQGRVYVACHGRKILGYVAVKARDGVGNINSVAVLPDWQVKGIGEKLVNVGINVLRQEGCRCVELECDVGYLPRFYSKMGFEVSGYYTTDVGDRQRHRVCMRRVL